MAQSESRRRAASGPVALSPSVLEWALEDSGMDAVELAARTDVSVEDLRAWISGDDRPTRSQFVAMAKELARPEDFFLLPEPPSLPSIPAELRKAADGTRLSSESIVAIRSARHIQAIVSWIVEDAQQPPESVIALRSMGQTLPEDALPERIRDWTELRDSDHGAGISNYVAFNRRREAVEGNGIIVMQRRLGSEGFRGFSIDDPWVPMIVVNRQETPEARSFTLMHELSHLTIGGSSSCTSVAGVADSAPEVERKCDGIASRVLIPTNDLLQVLSSIQGSDDTNDRQLVRRIARRFGVSLRASAIALLELGAVSRSAYGDIDRWSPSPVSPRKPDGDDFPRETRVQNRLRELGRLVISTLLDAERRGRVTEHDVLDYLDLDRDSLPKLIKAVGGQ